MESVSLEVEKAKMGHVEKATNINFPGAALANLNKVTKLTNFFSVFAQNKT